jgi:hypothetical protein
MWPQIQSFALTHGLMPSTSNQIYILDILLSIYFNKYLELFAAQAFLALGLVENFLTELVLIGQNIFSIQARSFRGELFSTRHRFQRSLKAA